MKIELEQNTPEWLTFRESRIGGSDIPVIMGLSSAKTPYRLWCEKLGLSIPDAPHPGMLKGVAEEPSIRSWASEVTGYLFQPEVHVNAKYEWAIASLDGLYDDDGVVTTLECKYNAKVRHEAVKQGEVDPGHMMQMQWGFFCTGADVCIYASKNGDDYAYVTIERDDQLIMNILSEAQNFKTFLDDKTPPFMQEKDHELIEIHNQEALTLAAELEIVERKRKEAKAEFDALTKEQKSLVQQLREFSDDGSFICGPVIVQRQDCQGTVDYKALLDAHNITKEQQNEYRKAPITKWVVRIK